MRGLPVELKLSHLQIFLNFSLQVFSVALHVLIHVTAVIIIKLEAAVIYVLINLN